MLQELATHAGLNFDISKIGFQKPKAIFPTFGRRLLAGGYDDAKLNRNYPYTAKT